jgi:glycosyltransferase involved in cell wall biosynthesis
VTLAASGAATPIRVLYVSHTSASGGSSASLRHLISALPLGSVEPHLVCPEGPSVESFRAAGVRVHPIGAVVNLLSIWGVPLRGIRLLDVVRNLWFMRFGRTLRRTITELRPDVVHLNERGMFQAAFIAHRAGIPVVLHARSVADPQVRWIRRFSRWWISRWVSRVVAIDESVRHSLRDTVDAVVIYNPLPSTSAPDTRSATATGTPLRVTYLTGLLAFKGIWDLLACAVRLRDRADIVFQVAGANSRPREFHDSLAGKVSNALGLTADLESAVRRYVQHHSLANVQLVGHVADSSDLLERTDVLVFPSHLNGIGRAVFEAGSVGIPSIVSLTNRIEDIVVDGDTGIIVPPKDPAALAAAVIRLAEDRALRSRLGDAARRKYIPQFDGAAIGRKMRDLYISLVRRPGAAPAPASTTGDAAAATAAAHHSAPRAEAP